MAATARTRILLLSGNPKSGRTTLMRALATGLSGLGPRGLLTEAIETDHGDRLGYRLLTFDGREAVVAHRSFDSDTLLGPYGVDVEALDEFADAALDPALEAPVWLVDEVGQLTSLSDRFVERMTALLDGKVPVIATVATRGSGFVGRVRRRPDAELWEVTPESRDALPARIAEWLAPHLGDTNGAPSGEAARV